MINLCEIGEHKTVCLRCRAEGHGEEAKEGCRGDCPNCGRFLDHGEEHAPDCTLEEDYKLLEKMLDEGDES